MSAPHYDTIGLGYRDHRRPDPRIQAALLGALGDARTVLNVGAGTGSYEPDDRAVVAIEPSAVMIAQRPRGVPGVRGVPCVPVVPVVRGVAEALPFPDRRFDAALAVLTLHHWRDPEAGLAELRRVVRRRVVLLTWSFTGAPFWLRDYLPEIRTVDAAIFPSLEQIAGVLGPLTETPLPVPHDCTDGFLCAYWRRPSAYLDPGVRRSISTFARVRDVDAGLDRLRRDLESGAWRARYGAIESLAELDLGYQIVVADMGMS